MSTVTYTIDTTHFTPPTPHVRTPRIRRIAKAEWTKLRTLPSTWRTLVALAFVISVVLGTILCVFQVQQWTKMTAGQRQMFGQPPVPSSASSSSVPCCSRHLGYGS